jgi:RNA polymerase sigma-70 factor (subfamily 1)
MIAFNCPGCGKTIQGKDEFVGTEAKCAECKTVFIVTALTTPFAGRVESKPKFFISYRREDSAGFTGRLFDRLQAHFGRESVFIDVDSIPLGVDFSQHLTEAVSKCDALLAVIADRWVGSGHDGQSRLHDPKDFVRIEIEAALSRKIPVIPILVGRTSMPLEDELPLSMRPLIFRNACTLDLGTHFHANVDRLIHSLEQFRKKAPNANPFPFPLDELRKYLHVVAQALINPRWEPRFDASDVVQETMVKAYEDASKFRGSTRSQLEAWLRAILTHTLINMTNKACAKNRDVRKEHPLTALVEETSARFERGLHDQALSPEEQAEQDERSRHLILAISELPNRQREAIILRYYQGWPIEQIATHLKLSYQATASVIHRGLEKLRTGWGTKKM